MHKLPLVKVQPELEMRCKAAAGVHVGPATDELQPWLFFAEQTGSLAHLFFSSRCLISLRCVSPGSCPVPPPCSAVTCSAVTFSATTLGQFGAGSSSAVASTAICLWPLSPCCSQEWFSLWGRRRRPVIPSLFRLQMQ